MTTPASTRGTTSFLIGSAPSARIASICSVTAIEPSSAAMPAPMRQPTTSEVSEGASSRASERPTMRPTLSRAPKRSSENANWIAMTMPTKIAVAAAIPNELHAHLLELVEERAQLEPRREAASGARGGSSSRWPRRGSSRSSARRPCASMARTKIVRSAPPRSAAVIGPPSRTPPRTTRTPGWRARTAIPAA